MNRRKFLEALTGIPLLGLLAKLPKPKEDLSIAALRKGLASISDSVKLVVPRLQPLDVAVQETKQRIAAYYTLLPGGKGVRTMFVDLVSGDRWAQPRGSSYVGEGMV